ncbi:MAG TPA: hypothetical protein VIZ18_10430 [Ktedonobacteraceae bacterium]
MKRFLSVAMLLCVVTVLAGVLSLKTVGAKDATASGQILLTRLNSLSCGKWSVVSAPHPNVSSDLSAVAVVSASDAWAVGSAGNQASGAQTLIEHWNGTNWQIVTSPSPGSFYNILYGVTAISASNVWAVGFDAGNSGATQTLVEHWNGTSWSAVTSPSPASINNELFSVAAVSASNIWAVGFATINSGQTPTDETLIEHWNGTAWSVVKSPSPGSNDHLNGVAAISASDVWAVGNANTFGQTLIERWNGSQWNVVKSASAGSSSDLRDVAVVSASNVWAVGYALIGSSIQTFTEHWNGTGWQAVKSPNIGSSPAFSGVAAISASDVWAVGSDLNSSNNFQTLTERWNGSAWSIVASPNQDTISAQLLGVAALSATDVWAVGHAGSNPLIEHFHC